MSYNATQAQGGLGALFKVNTGTVSTPTYTIIAEMVDTTPSGYENKVEEATNTQSTAVERQTTIPDGGMWPFNGNRVSSDAGQTKMAALFASGAIGQFEVVLPKLPGQSSTGDTYAFNGIVTKWNPAIKAVGLTKVAGEVATSNGVVYTEGS